jgi:hypothetical protein
MDTESFYADLPVLDSFLAITDSQNFKPVPCDWYILITDIVGSTKAIRAGRYKDVNLIGASSIIAVLNIARNIEIPFIFGGDGAAILIPPSLFPKARDALLATRQEARIKFGIQLRVGAVPVSDVIRAGYDVQIAKIKVSDNYYQSAFTGNGLSYATQLIKNPESAEAYSYKHPLSGIKADFSGLECRWQDIPSNHGETVSLIVRAITDKSEVNNKIYREVIEQILLIYGTEEYLNPISKEQLKLAFSYKYLKSETLLRAKHGKFQHKMIYFYKILIENLLGWFLMTFKVQLPDIDWGAYKENTIATTDCKKFDDMLRMIIDGNKEQRINLTRYLKENYRKGNLVYGLHISDRALMTCLVFERSGHQVHFIDGADGGYAVAAKAMKRRIRRIESKRGGTLTFLNFPPSTTLHYGRGTACHAPM